MAYIVFSCQIIRLMLIMKIPGGSAHKGMWLSGRASMAYDLYCVFMPDNMNNVINEISCGFNVQGDVAQW